MQGEWRLKLARWLAPEREEEEEPVEVDASAAPTDAWVKDAWVGVCEQFALRMLVLVEQLRPALDRLEGDEDDPDRLQWLYHVDHGVSRMRQAARDLRVLAGREAEDAAGHNSSLLDMIRTAASAIEHYDRVSVGPVAELAVMAYAVDDIASLLAVLADNGTRYSPSVVRISAHLLADGGVMVRVEDSGIGIEPERLAVMNAVLSGPVPEVGVYTGKHTGFPVAHRLARRHGVEIRLACRPTLRGMAGGATGTVAMVNIPASLVCEIPEAAPADPTPPRDSIPATRGTPEYSTNQLRSRVEEAGRHSPPARPAQPALPAPPSWPVRPDEEATDQPAPKLTRNGLPRREPGSARNAAAGRSVVAGSLSVPDRGGTPDPAASGRSFAADVAAFLTGSPDSGRPAAGDATVARWEEPEGLLS
jgi:hypothetical protein